MAAAGRFITTEGKLIGANGRKARVPPSDCQLKGTLIRTLSQASRKYIQYTIQNNVSFGCQGLSAYRSADRRSPAFYLPPQQHSESSRMINWCNGQQSVVTKQRKHATSLETLHNKRVGLEEGREGGREGSSRQRQPMILATYPSWMHRQHEPQLSCKSGQHHYPSVD